MGNFFEDAWDSVSDPVNLVLGSNPVTATAAGLNTAAGFRPTDLLQPDQSGGSSSGGNPIISVEMPDYSAYYERMSALTSQANEIAARQVAVGERMLGISEEQYAWWKTNYQPYEQELIDQAKRGTDIPYWADVAGNRVGLAYAAQRGAADRSYERLGTGLTGERLARIRDDIALREAADKVNARNNARKRAAETGRAMTQTMAAMGKGVSGESLSAFSQGARSLASSADSVNAGAAGLAAAIKAGNQGAATAADAYYRNQAAQEQVNAQADHMRDVSQANYNAWLYGTIGNTVGTVAGGTLAAAMNGGGNRVPLDQQTANTMLAPQFRDNRVPMPPGVQ